MSRPRMSLEQWAEHAQAKVDAALSVLADEVAALRSGEDWQRFLSFQARLHAYSANNVLLVYAQHAQAFAEGRVATPEPTYVAGFHTWKTLGRSVEKGQRGYAILAPVTGVRRVAIDEVGHARPLGRDETAGPGEHEERRSALRGFKVEHVFDVDQTQGAPVPEPQRPSLLTGVAPEGLGAAIAGLIEESGFSVSTVPDAAALGGANGRTDFVERTVVVRGDIDDAAMVKTLLHEAGHVLLHEAEPGRTLARKVQEVEAESVAFVVAAAHGMDTSGYSFPYVAAWAGSDHIDVVSATQRRVAQAAQALIAASPAPHVDGGRAPGAELALHRSQSRTHLAATAIPAATARNAAPPMGLGL